jgi:AraC-like DNA-binding protein
VDFSKYPVSDNTLFFLSPGQVHRFEDVSHLDGVIIHFPSAYLSEEEAVETVFLKYNLFHAFDAVPCFHIDADCASELGSIVDAISREAHLQAAFAHDDYMKSLIRLFLIDMQRFGHRADRSQLQISNRAHLEFVKFRQLMEHHYRHLHQVRDYAGLLNISQKSLTNYVLTCSGTTPLRLIIARIVLDAKRQLRQSSRSVKEIGYSLGFDDPSYFVKFFKRNTGSLPAEFRQTAEV